jgi:pimeloyl-ACP methyl ester carboxylesterase
MTTVAPQVKADYTYHQERFVNSRDVLYYEEKGFGQPLILLSGLGATRLFWWKQVDVLSRSLRVIAVDNRDAGDSPLSSAPYTIGDMAGDTARLIADLNRGPVHIIGISMGGFIALDLALRYPHLIARMVLVSTSAGGPAHVQAGPDLDDILTRIDGEGAEARMRRIVPFLMGHGYADLHPADVNRYVEIFIAKPMGDEPYERQMGAATDYARRGTAEGLADITASVMVVHGTADRVIPFSNGQYLASHIRHSLFSVFRGVGHLPPIEDSDRFNREVLRFLQNP